MEIDKLNRPQAQMDSQYDEQLWDALERFSYDISLFAKLYNESGVTSVHSALSNLAWAASGHTGTALTLAGFDSLGVSEEYLEANYLLADGTRKLTASWNAGNYAIRAGNTRINGDGIDFAVGAGKVMRFQNYALDYGFEFWGNDGIIEHKILGLDHVDGIELFHSAYIKDGEILQINSAGDDKNITISHNDTDGIIAVDTGSLIFGPSVGNVLLQCSTSSPTIFRVAAGSDTNPAGFYLTCDSSNPNTSANSNFGMLVDSDYDQSVMFVSDTSGNHTVFCNIDHRNVDWAKGVQTNPTFYFQSDSSTTANNLNIQHDGSNGIITVDSGSFQVKPSSGYTNLFTGASAGGLFFTDTSNNKHWGIYTNDSQAWANFWLSDNVGNQINICNEANRSTDLGVATAADPLLNLWGDAGANRMFLYYDDTDGNIGTSSGDLKLQTNIEIDTDGQIVLVGDAKVKKTTTYTFNYARITGQGKPTLVNRGIFFGYSLPIYNSDDEELYACECVPYDWDGASSVTFYVGGWLDTANTDKNFKLQVSVEHWTTGDTVPTTSSDIEVETATGTADQYKSFKIAFTYDAVTAGIQRGDAIGIRVRRIAASTDEISGEFVVEGAAVEFTSNRIGEPV